MIMSIQGYHNMARIMHNELLKMQYVPILTASHLPNLTLSDPNIDPADRISAHHLVAEIAAAVLRLYEGGPAILSQRHTFPRTSLTGPATTGLKLVLNNNKMKKEEGQELG
jgi:hypothetical protein